MTAVAKIKQTEVVKTAAPMPPTNDSISLLTIFERIATNPEFSNERVEQAFALYQRVQLDTSRRAFDNALAAAKAQIPTINKNRRVDFTSQKGRTNYNYEDLSEIARTVDPILGANGLSYRFRTKQSEQSVSVTCILSHSDGYSEENTLVAGYDISGNKNAIQAVGSTITYLQRYTLKASLGLAASKDDDGKISGGSDLITDDQAEELANLITETRTDIHKFLEFGGIESLADMPARDFLKARGVLLTKLKNGRKQ